MFMIWKQWAMKNLLKNISNNGWQEQNIVLWCNQDKGKQIRLSCCIWELPLWEWLSTEQEMKEKETWQTIKGDERNEEQREICKGDNRDCV